MKIKKWVYLLWIPYFVLLFTLCSEKESGLDIIQVEGGLISGKVIPDSSIRLYAGIPYATPPVGELRWREPQPVESWEGIKNADQFSTICYQYPMPEGSFYEKEFYPDGLPEQSENCLCLNVWTPAKSNRERLPVVMWIHGGALDHGWGHEPEFDGEAFAKKGVILVTINYRVGIFGFMAHPWLEKESGNHSSGNYGILDQIAALRWIRENIKEFGGDPENITVMGQSAGARSTMAILSSPLTKDLFKGAIVQSGGGYRRGGLFLSLEEKGKIGKAFTDYLQVDNLQSLRSLSPYELMEAREAFNASRRLEGMSILEYSPTIDRYVLNGDFDITLERGQQHLVPAMIGYNSEDGNPEVLEKAAVEWSRIREQQGQPATFVYRFQRQMPGDDAGAFHSAELWYIFGTLSRSWRPFTEADKKLSEEMITYWTNFARFQKPTANFMIGAWPPYSIRNPYIKVFDVTD